MQNYTEPMFCTVTLRPICYPVHQIPHWNKREIKLGYLLNIDDFEGEVKNIFLVSSAHKDDYKD